MSRRLAARWLRLALDAAPCARSSHGLSVIGGRAYVYGGEASARHAIGSEVHTLDVEGSKWETIASPSAPPPRVGHAQCVLRDALMVFGGRTDVDMGEGNLNDLWAFEPSESAWTQVETEGVAPSPRSFHRATAVGDKLYVFGGCGAEGRLADLHELDLSTRRWSALPTPPGLAGRGGATFEASPDGRALWVCGGFTGEESNDLLQYELASETWKRMPSEWLRPRSVCASMSLSQPHGGVLMVFGGEVSPSDKGHEGAGGFAADLLAIDPASGEPLHVTVDEGLAPEARGWGAAAALSPSEGIIFGGLTGSDEAPRRLDDAWVLTVDEDPPQGNVYTSTIDGMQAAYKRMQR